MPVSYIVVLIVINIALISFCSAACQIHSSLLILSVGALLLPAAYHFTVSDSQDEGAQTQKADILRMSYGVSNLHMYPIAAP